MESPCAKCQLIYYMLSFYKDSFVICFLIKQSEHSIECSSIILLIVDLINYSIFKWFLLKTWFLLFCWIDRNIYECNKFVHHENIFSSQLRMFSFIWGYIFCWNNIFHDFSCCFHMLCFVHQVSLWHFSIDMHILDMFFL